MRISLIKIDFGPYDSSSLLIRVSSVVEQWTVNPLVVSSNLTPGVSLRDLSYVFSDIYHSLWYRIFLIVFSFQLETPIS